MLNPRYNAGSLDTIGGVAMVAPKVLFLSSAILFL